MKTVIRVICCLMLPVFIMTACTSDKTEAGVSLKDYQRAARMLPGYTSQFLYGASVSPEWINDSQFWYKNTTRNGFEYILADAENMERKQLFDHEKLATQLSEITGESFSAMEPPLKITGFSRDMSTMFFRASGRTFTYNLLTAVLDEYKIINHSGPNSIKSPDGKKEAFIREYNLWIRDLANGKETQLTFDGIENYGYATNNAGWTRRESPVLLWSPDSKKIATFQHDSRGVGEMYLVTTNVGHPELHAWKYPLPGDRVIFRIQRVIIHVEKPRVVRLKMKPDQHRSTITDHVATREGRFADVEWSQDSKMLAFVSTSRDHKHEVFRIADPETGDVRGITESCG